MAARDRMTHRATIERSTAGRDQYGNALPATWSVHINGCPCYYWQPSVARAEIEGERNYRAYGHHMMVPLGTDVRESDRVNGIVDRRGSCVSADVFGIIAIVHKPDHLLVTMETIK